MDTARLRSSVERARSTADRARSTLGDTLQSASDRWPPVAFAAEAGGRWMGANGSVLAGHLTFRLFLFIVPAMLIGVASLGYAAASGTSLDATSEGELTFSKAMAEAITSTGEQARDARFQALVVGLFGLLLAGLSLVKALRVIFAAIWQLDTKKQGSLPAVLGSVIALVIVLILTLAINRRLSREGLLATGLGVAVLMASGTVFMLLLSWQLPRRRTRMRDLLGGALVAGVGFAALNTGAAWYFTRKLESTAQVYGALGVTVTLLTYLFLWSELLVLAAVVNTVWYDRILLGGELVPGVDEADVGLVGEPADSTTGDEDPPEAAPVTAPAAGAAIVAPQGEPGPVAAAARPSRGVLVRRVVTVPLSVFTATLLLASVVAGWSHYILLNSDGWQSTVVPLLEDPEIRAAVGDELSTQIVTAIDVEERARELLPDRAQVLAPAIASGIDSFIRARVQDGLASDEVQSLWAEANARLHPKVVAFLRGEQVGGISAAEGVVTINLLPLMSRVLARIDQRAPGLVTRDRPVPVVEPSMDERQARAELSTAVGITLPDGFGIITLPRSERLARLQSGVALFDRIVIVLPLLTTALLVGLIVIAPNKRAALVWLGASALVLAAAVLAGIRVARDELTADIHPVARQHAVVDAVTHVLSSLRTIAILVFVVGVVVTLVAGLSGTRARQWVTRGIGVTRHRLAGQGPLVTSIVAGVIAALVVVWLVAGSPTVLTFLLALIVLAGCGVVIARRRIGDALGHTIDRTRLQGLPPPPAPAGSPALADDRPATEADHH
jgi:uncharacterized BrkB/YihY/UPF0761 family membrane protein